MNSLKQITINLLIPLGISLLFVLLFIKSKEVPEIIFTLAPYIFYALSILIIWVSWRFNRNRFIFIVLPLVLLAFGVEYLGDKESLLLITYTSLLFPLHLLVFALLNERGLFSIWGILKIIFTFMELAFVLYLIYNPQLFIEELIDIKLFAKSFYPLKDVAIGIGIFTTFVLSAMVIFNRYLIYNASFLVILFSLYVGLYYSKTPHVLELSLLVINIIIFVVLIRESYRLAFYDELTQLPGRRALVEDMAKLGMKYSLAMVDIDFFKKFNDTYGHDTGDEVLKMVASRLADVSGGGKAYRYGGEEFVLLFPSVEASVAFGHTDLLRNIISKSGFIVRNKNKTKKIFVNISAGIVQNSSKDRDAFGVMKRADNALYKAKKAGRNKVIQG